MAFLCVPFTKVEHLIRDWREVAKALEMDCQDEASGRLSCADELEKVLKGCERVSGRKEFERWASEPPREWDTSRWPDDSTQTSWPGQYVKYYVQCSWEVWEELRSAEPVELRKEKIER